MSVFLPATNLRFSLLNTLFVQITLLYAKLCQCLFLFGIVDFGSLMYGLCTYVRILAQVYE